MKRWTRNKHYKDWIEKVYKHRKVSRRHQKEDPKVDLCDSDRGFCTGHKEIPRRLMPQIYNTRKFARNIERKYGVKLFLNNKDKHPANIYIIEDLFSKKSNGWVMKLAFHMIDEERNKPIIISSINKLASGLNFLIICLFLKSKSFIFNNFIISTPYLHL